MIWKQGKKQPVNRLYAQTNRFTGKVLYRGGRTTGRMVYQRSNDPPGHLARVIG